MTEVKQYTTRNRDKAIALFIEITGRGRACNLMAAQHDDHIEGYVLVYDITDSEFREIRALLSDRFPSTSKAIEDMPETLDVPDHLPEDFS